MNRLHLNAHQPYYRVSSKRGCGWIAIDGRRLTDFAANDYLGLAYDYRVVARAREAISEYGAGAGSSAVLGGETQLHAELRERLALWTGQADVMLFPSGYQASLGVVAALGRRHGIALEEGAHASLVHGAAAARHGVIRFVQDVEGSLRRALERLRKVSGGRRAVVVVDGIESMSGRVCPLDELHQVAAEFDALLLVDEAHSLGVFGQGRGVAYDLVHAGHAVIQVGTFSKALGSSGGFAAGRRDVTDFLRSTCLPGIFSAALAPSLAGAALEALNVIMAEPERIAGLKNNAVQLRIGIDSIRCEARRNAGYSKRDIPIVPIVMGGTKQLLACWKLLMDSGCFTSPIMRPACGAVPAQLRVSCSWGHSPAEIDHLLGSLAKCVQRWGS